MSLDGVLITDVSRLTKECNTSFFFLVTGPRGSGKTFTLRSFAKGVASGTENGAAAEPVFQLLTDHSTECQPGSPLHVRMLDFGRLKRESGKITSILRSTAARQPIFVSGSVLVVDDLEALWSLCALNGELPLLRSVLKTLLASPACALVASAKSENNVPAALMEWRRPMTYALPPLTQASARRTIRAGFGASGENDFAVLENCVAALSPATTRGSLLLALCMAKGGNSAAHGETGTVKNCLSWLENSGERLDSAADREAESARRKEMVLYGLEDVWRRACMLVSVFAGAKGVPQKCENPSATAPGGLAAALQSTTGMLLHGPSGCGKTALARQLAEAFPKLAFFFVQCTGLFSKYLGESEEKLRHVYRKARARAPSVVILDDVDVIAQSRGAMSSGAEDSSQGSANVNKRMLAGLLCELDGVTDNAGVLTIGTTNAPEVLDSALLRQGRLETLLYVAPLSLGAALAMANQFFTAFAGLEEEKRERALLIARAAVGCSAAALQFLLRKLLEHSLAALPKATSDDEGTRATGKEAAVPLLPLPSSAAVDGVLLETSAMMPRCVYTFDAQR